MCNFIERRSESFFLSKLPIWLIRPAGLTSYKNTPVLGVNRVPIEARSTRASHVP